MCGGVLGRLPWELGRGRLPERWVGLFVCSQVEVIKVSGVSLEKGMKRDKLNYHFFLSLSLPHLSVSLSPSRQSLSDPSLMYRLYTCSAQLFRLRSETLGFFRLDFRLFVHLCVLCIQALCATAQLKWPDYCHVSVCLCLSHTLPPTPTCVLTLKHIHTHTISVCSLLQLVYM